MTQPAAAPHKVHSLRHLTESAFVLRFDRNGMDYQPGQYVSVGERGNIHMREYSVYSPPSEESLEILVKEVAQGHVSRRLKRLAPGSELQVDGPFGFFTIDTADQGRPFLFVATGTGISPFHCFAASYPGLNYRLLHGVRTLAERYERDVFDPARVTTCVSRERIDGAKPMPCHNTDLGASGSPPDNATAGVGSHGIEEIVGGRVTDYLRTHPVAPDTLCYLCGNCDMIYEAFDILKDHGVPPEQLFAEVYF